MRTPIALGGTYCIPGPFGAGKTVLQQITSRNADVDIVIIALIEADTVILHTGPRREHPVTGYIPRQAERRRTAP